MFADRYSGRPPIGSIPFIDAVAIHYALAFRSPLHYCIVIACIIQVVILHMLYYYLHSTMVMIKSNP